MFIRFAANDAPFEWPLPGKSKVSSGVDLRPTKANRRSTALSNRYWTWCDRSTCVAFASRGVMSLPGCAETAMCDNYQWSGEAPGRFDAGFALPSTWNDDFCHVLLKK